MEIDINEKYGVYNVKYFNPQIDNGEEFTLKEALKVGEENWEKGIASKVELSHYNFPSNFKEDAEICKQIIFEYFSQGLKHLEPIEVLLAFNNTDPKEYLSEKDYEYWQSLPDEVEVYRGCDIHELDETGFPLGISWTVDYKVAEFFAYRYKNDEGCVIKAKVPKSLIKCYENDRSEAEVIITDPFIIMLSGFEIVSQGEWEGYSCEDFHKYIDEKKIDKYERVI